MARIASYAWAGWRMEELDPIEASRPCVLEVGWG